MHRRIDAKLAQRLFRVKSLESWLGGDFSLRPFMSLSRRCGPRVCHPVAVAPAGVASYEIPPRRFTQDSGGVPKLSRRAGPSFALRRGSAKWIRIAIGASLRPGQWFQDWQSLLYPADGRVGW